MEPEAGGGGAGGAPFPQDICRGSRHPEQTPADPGWEQGEWGRGWGASGYLLCAGTLCIVSFGFFKQ